MENIKKSLYQKLLEIEKVILGLGKDKAGTNYRYVTGDKVLGVVKPLMITHGLLLKQEILSIDNSRQDYTVGANTANARIKSEILSKVMMKFTWVDCETGEKDENLFGANGQNDWDKGVGSALTYAERYFLLKYFHIATDEDDIDNPDRKQEETQPRQIAEPTTQEKANNMLKKQPDVVVPEAVKKEISDCNSLGLLGGIFNAHPELHENKEFTTLLGERKTALKSTKP